MEVLGQSEHGRQQFSVTPRQIASMAAMKKALLDLGIHYDASHQQHEQMLMTGLATDPLLRSPR